VSDQVGRNAFGICLKLVDELRIPEVVKVSGPEAGGRNLFVVAATAQVAGIEFRPNDLASPRIARLTDDLLPKISN